jgi:hypothetical protein
LIFPLPPTVSTAPATTSNGPAGLLPALATGADGGRAHNRFNIPIFDWFPSHGLSEPTLRRINFILRKNTMAKQSERQIVQTGEYHSPNDRAAAQRQFLDALRRHAPVAMKALRDEVLPVYQLVQGNEGQVAFLDDARLRQVDWAIWDWAVRFHLIVAPAGQDATSGPYARSRLNPFGLLQKPEGWVWAIVFPTLRHWDVNPAARAVLEWPPDKLSGAGKPSPFKYDFQTAAWDVRSETRNQARARILAEVADQLDTAMDSEEAECVKVGMAKVGRKAAAEHFEWLVRYQVLGHSFKCIAKVCHRTRQAITSGAHDAAELLVGPNWKSWLRPPGKPGRPPKE